jgi:hypothetical protein
MLRPRLDILPPAQQAIWAELAAVPPDFVLYGGTALALRLAHRISEDFDFFSNRPFRPDELEREIGLLGGAVRIQASANTLVSIADRGGPVKLSFFGGLSLSRVGDPDRAEGPGILVASLLDVAATKVKVVQDRAEAKDYFDVAQLLEAGIGLDEALGAARAVYGADFNPVPSLKALSYFGDGDLSSLAEPVRVRLGSAVRELDITRIPEIRAQSGGLAS